MPELPEVEAIRHYLTSRNVIGAKLQDVSADGGIVQTSALNNHILGSTITRIDRRGKYIIVVLANTNAGDTRLILHMGMTGSLHLSAADRQTSLGHVRATIRLHDGNDILLNDPRRWAKIWIAHRGDIAPTDKLGPELSDISPIDFAERVRQRTQRIKPALLDQNLVAGIGNIYADEALHAARISPLRRASNIGIARLHNLHTAISAAFEHATRHIIDNPAPDGSPYIVDAHDARFLIPRHGQGACPSCQEPLTRTKINARTTIYCKSCQR